MGGQAVLTQIRKSSIGLIVAGAIIGVLGLMLSAGALMSTDGDSTGILIVGVIIIAVAATMLYFGMRNYKDPTKTSAFKSNPDILQMADELANDIKYEDKFIRVSSRIIGTRNDLTKMTFMDEIYCIYLFKQSTNFIPTGKDIVLRTARGEIHISVYGQKKEVIDQLANTIISMAPLIRVGYTPENLSYADNMVKQWKQYRQNMPQQ